jgi:hypothetical protein
MGYFLNAGEAPNMYASFCSFVPDDWMSLNLGFAVVSESKFEGGRSVVSSKITSTRPSFSIFPSSLYAKRKKEFLFGIFLNFFIRQIARDKSLDTYSYGRRTMSTIRRLLPCPVAFEKSPDVEFLYFLPRPWGLA